MKSIYSLEEGRSVFPDKLGLKGASLCELYAKGSSVNYVHMLLLNMLEAFYLVFISV